MKKTAEKIAVIGMGNMGQAIIQGLLKKQTFHPSQFIVSSPTMSSLVQYHSQGLKTTTENSEAVHQADCILLAVKPQILPSVLTSLVTNISRSALIISIAAGIPISQIKDLTDHMQPVIRAMPNLNAKVQQSATVFVTSPEVTENHVMIATKIFEPIGIFLPLPSEDLIDTASAIAGCGPAYYFLLTEALEKAGLALGLPENLTAQLLLQTFTGSAELLRSTQLTPTLLRTQVTSKGGITQAAIAILQEHKFDSLIQTAVSASVIRAKELSGKK